MVKASCKTLLWGLTMPENNRDNKQSFIKKFNDIAHHKHRYDVFRDFVTISAISLHNAVNKVELLEDKYMKIIKPYTKNEVNAFAEFELPNNNIKELVKVQIFSLVFIFSAVNCKF